MIEDHTIVRKGLKLLLESDPQIEVVGEAANRAQAFEIATQHKPNLFLVDLLLGQDVASDFLKELLAVSSGARAVLHTGVTDGEHVRRAIDAGATGLVYKDEVCEVLLRAIQKVQDRKSVV